MRHLAIVTCALLASLAIGASAARAETPIEAFERQVDADRNALGIPGLSIAVIQDGEVLSARGFGFADIEHRIPATADTLYHLASVTKTFTAILVLRLVEQGKLDLDEPVSHYSSDFKDDAVRIKHLLSHTSAGVPGERFQYDGNRRSSLATATGHLPRP